MKRADEVDQPSAQSVGKRYINRIWRHNGGKSGNRPAALVGVEKYALRYIGRAAQYFLCRWMLIRSVAAGKGFPELFYRIRAFCQIAFQHIDARIIPCDFHTVDKQCETRHKDDVIISFLPSIIQNPLQNNLHYNQRILFCKLHQ